MKRPAHADAAVLPMTVDERPEDTLRAVRKATLQVEQLEKDAVEATKMAREKSRAARVARTDLHKMLSEIAHPLFKAANGE